MDIIESTHGFERWLRGQVPVVEFDLDFKHRQMTADVFLFMRATFYRWIQIWPEICSELATAPEVPALADVHVENFGTWRDVEGRLVWGANDFDEAAPLPYPQDLVRLGTSALLSQGRPELSSEIAAAILDGYRWALQEKGEPMVLGREHRIMRGLALRALEEPAEFWTKLEVKSRIVRDVPKSARRAVQDILPGGADLPQWRVITKPKGLGSLGRPRYVAVAMYHGEAVAREAKAFVPSAVNWAWARKCSSKGQLEKTIARAVRCPDPFWSLRDGWQARRLSPDCRRLDLEDLHRSDDFMRVIRAMGKEVANIHLGEPESRSRILRHLRKLPVTWLHEAMDRMAVALNRDWKQWVRESKK